MSQSFSAYIHVPFCSSRCGYCDFNTYTALELSRDGTTISQANYVETLAIEIEMAANQLGQRPISTIFFGGGTPTLLIPSAIETTLVRLEDQFGIVEGAEITTEANPESVTKSSLAQLREAGLNRISFGMQSAVPHVLSTLDRTHSPDRLISAVNEAKAVGFDHISVDLIYGTPGESLADWRESIDAALDLPIDHVSAYSLIVEEGTKFAKKVSQGEVVIPDDDETADKYEMASAAFERAGLDWYEVSNWARPGGECKHNLAYWAGGDWWGFGPGAHSHFSGTRWWNVKHPAAYAQRLSATELPVMDRETLTSNQLEVERIMLNLRLRSGLPTQSLPARQTRQALEDGYFDPASFDRGLAVLTMRGRLMADAVVRSMVENLSLN
ncbi:MAG TPA: radical SAM family heme chaperone HemW [Candidatus Nanopelagicaceae bacterium]|nr:radical SAM family heme chaperone HemW [Candidatus Nanopelagicaceae bacterium]